MAQEEPNSKQPRLLTLFYYSNGLIVKYNEILSGCWSYL